MSRAVRSGVIAAVLHVVLIGAIAFFVAFPNRTFGGPELWFFAAIIDLPVHFLAGAMLPYYLPTFITAHDFMFAVVLYGVGGTLQWFLIVLYVTRHMSRGDARHPDI